MITSLNAANYPLDPRVRRLLEQEALQDRCARYLSKSIAHPNPSSFYSYLKEQGKTHVLTSPEDLDKIGELQKQFSKILVTKNSCLEKDVNVLSVGDFSALDRFASLSDSRNLSLEDACSLGLTEQLQEILLSTSCSITDVAHAIQNVGDPSLQRKLLEKLASNVHLRPYFTRIRERDPDWMHALVFSGIESIQAEPIPPLKKDLLVRNLFHTFCPNSFSPHKYPILQKGEVERAQIELSQIPTSSLLKAYLKKCKLLTADGCLAENPTLLETRNQLEYALQYLANTCKKTCLEIEQTGYHLWLETLPEDQQLEEECILHMQKGAELPVTYDLLLWNMVFPHLKKAAIEKPPSQEMFLKQELEHLLACDPSIREKIHSLYRDCIDENIPSSYSDYDVYFTYMQKLKSLYKKVSEHLDHPLYAVAIEEAYAARDISFLLFVQKALLEYRIPSKQLGKMPQNTGFSPAFQNLEKMMHSRKKRSKVQEFFTNECLRKSALDLSSFPVVIEETQKFMRETNFSFLKDFFCNQGIICKDQLMEGSCSSIKEEMIRLNKDLFLYLVKQEAQKIKKAIPDQDWTLFALDIFAKEVVYEKFSKMLQIFPESTMTQLLKRVLNSQASNESKLLKFKEIILTHPLDPNFIKFHSYWENPFPCPNTVPNNPWKSSLILQPVLGEFLLKLGCRWSEERAFQDNYFELFSALYFTVQGMKEMIRTSYSLEQGSKMYAKLSQAWDLHKYSEIERILKSISQPEKSSGKKGDSFHPSSKVFETLSWFAEQSFSDSLDLPEDIWKFSFPYNQKSEHLKRVFQVFYQKCCEEIHRLSMQDVFVNMLDTAIYAQDTQALEWIYLKIAHERYRSELEKLRQQGEAVEDLFHLEKAWEEAPLDRRIQAISDHLYKKEPSWIQKHLLQTLQSFPRGSLECVESKGQRIQERGQVYFENLSPRKYFQEYLQSRSFSITSWEKREIDQLHSLYKQFLLKKKKELLFTSSQIPYMDKGWRRHLTSEFKKFDLESHPREYEQLLLHAHHEWQSYLLELLDQLEFFDLHGLDEIVALMNCKNRSEALQLCADLRSSKHAVFLVMQLPPSKTDWKDFLIHTLPRSMHKDFFKELLQTEEGQVYFFKMAKMLNKEEDNSLWDLLEEAVETAVSTDLEKKEGSFFPLRDSEIVAFFFDHYLQSSKSAKTFFQDNQQDARLLEIFESWIANQGRNSLLNRFLSTYCKSIMDSVSDSPASYKMHILRICIPFLKDIYGRFDGTNDFMQINEFITERVFDSYVKSLPVENPIRVETEALQYRFQNQEISLQEMLQEASTCIHAHTGETLEQTIEPFLSFPPEILQRVFPWKPPKTSNSLLGTCFQKDGIQEGSLENFLETYIEASTLIGSILSIFQERYFFLKTIIKNQEDFRLKTYYQNSLEQLKEQCILFSKTRDLDLLCQFMENLVALEFQVVTGSEHPGKNLAQLRSLLQQNRSFPPEKKAAFLNLLNGEGIFVNWEKKIEEFDRWIANPLFSHFGPLNLKERSDLSFHEKRRIMKKIRYQISDSVERELQHLDLSSLYSQLLHYAKCNEQDQFFTWIVQKILYARYEKALQTLQEQDEALQDLRIEVQSLPIEIRIQKTKEFLAIHTRPHCRDFFEILTQFPWNFETE